jgi:Fuc2NAc and GlcNAc transferase
VSLIVIGAVVGALATWALVHASRALGVVAQPNARSSHDVATPTSGGVGFVVAAVSYCGLNMDEPLARAVLYGGGLLALVSLVDDVRHLPAAARLPVQVVVVLGTIWVLDVHELAIAGTAVTGAALVAILALCGVWLVNLYNFMDGIDGIAGSQALVFAAGVTLLGAKDGFAAELTWWTGAAVAGFLVFNWAPARIFMGDVGSAFLGFLVWAVAVVLAADGAVPFIASMVLLTAFWFDATYTLGIRVVTGQAFTTAHRSHLYQHLARRVGHGRTVAVYVGYGVVWLWPLSLAVRELPGLWPLWVGLACLPMAVACTYLGAGHPERAGLKNDNEDSDRG